MKPLVLTPLLLLLTAQLSVAQDFVPGSVTLNTGETLMGQIRDGSVKALGSKCQFQRTGETATTAYTPDKLRGFSLESRRFLSIKPSGVPPRFALILNEGSLSLYSTGDAFYVRPVVSDSLLLLVREATVVIGGELTKVEAYRFQLDSLFQACPALAGSTQRVSYQLNSLSEAVRAYNACVGVKTTYAAPMSKAKRRIGLKVVGSLANCQYRAFPADKTAQTIAYGVGGFVQFMGDKMVNGRLHMQLEAFYLRHQFGGEANYTQPYLCVPILLQYALTTSRTARPYLFMEGGLQASFSVGVVTKGLVQPPISDMVLSLPVGIGLQRGGKASGLDYALSLRYFRLNNTGSNRIQDIALNLSVGFYRARQN